MSLLLFFFLLLYCCNLALNGDVVVGSVWQMGEIRVLIFWLEEQEGRPQNVGQSEEDCAEKGEQEIKFIKLYMNS